MRTLLLNLLPLSSAARAKRGCITDAISVGFLLAVMIAPVYSHAADQFVKPTKEELEMTSLPGYPGAAAVKLFEEQITNDQLHVIQHYERIKILTEEGKKFANVELKFSSVTDGNENYGPMGYVEDKTVGDIVGRTIHADGTIIPFTGKPYLKTMMKGQNFRYQARVFTLPDVEVGSIIEYRYATRYSDDVVEAPDWYIQGPLFVKSAHYVWHPSTVDVTDGNGIASSIAWFPVLPKGVTLEHRLLPAGAMSDQPSQIYELNVKDIAPQPEEEYMPPIASLSYRVLFYYTTYRSSMEFWKDRGKKWAKGADSFIGPNGDLKGATESIIAGATTQDAKLRKIYAAVMTLENTDYTRARDVQEDKATGLGKVNNTSDVLSHKQGSATQITELFIGMARAAGMKAYLMIVPDRSERMFTPGWLSFMQFDNALAIVNVDGKEMYFDPGSRYCPYGHLSWGSTFVHGLRETDAGTDFGLTQGDTYLGNRTQRVANLTMDAQGSVSGPVDLTYTGAAALRWRQEALRGDEESVRRLLREHLEAMLPKSMEISVAAVENLQAYEEPLIVHYVVKGSLGTSTGKRLVLPVDMFTSADTATFPHEKRETAVYFHYPQQVQDALRIKLPKNFAIEAAPSSSRADLKGSAVYTISVAPAPDNIIVRRDFAYNDVIVPLAAYPALRTFYSQFESSDQGSVVLKTATPDASGAPKTEGN